MSQTFSSFRDAVRDFVTVDGQRHGVSLGSAKYFDRLVVAALLDLQSFIPQLRERHRSVFKDFDLTEEGDASMGTVPEGVMTDAYYINKSTCPCTSRPFVPYPYEHRMDLFCGKPRIVGQQYFFTVDPFADKFIVFPKIKQGSELWIYWNGMKSMFDDADVVRFGEAEAEAVAYFVKSRITREVDKDLLLSQSYWQSYAGSSSIMGIRSRLHVDWKQRSESPHASTSPQAGTGMADCSDCSGLACCWEGADCGFSGGHLYLQDGESLWHRITIAGEAGSEAFVVGAGVESPVWDDCVTPMADGYAFLGGFFHIWSSTLEDYVSITISGSGEGTTIQFGPRKGEVGSISRTARGYRFSPCLKILNTDTGEFCSLNLFDV